MEYGLVADDVGLATYALIFAAGDEVAAELTRFANETGVDGLLHGAGAASDASVG